MKINIPFDFKSASGGANQFLKGLKASLIDNDLYSDEITECSVVIVNCSPANFIRQIYKLVFYILKNKNLKIISRIDGPVCLIRSSSDFWDKVFIDFSNNIADGVVFQSQWSKDKLVQLGMNCEQDKIIYNAADCSIFHPGKSEIFTRSKPSRGRIRIIASSWSTNKNKGFADYHWLDENLDYNKYEFIFATNNYGKFRNIKEVGPLTSLELADLLRSGDVYITASRNDPCSNAVIEALASGLPVIAFNDGGHPEIVNENGAVYEMVSEIENCIMEVSHREFKHVSYNVSHAADQYVEFIAAVTKNGRSRYKVISFMLKFYIRLFFFRIGLIS